MDRAQTCAAPLFVAVNVNVNVNVNGSSPRTGGQD